MKKYIFFIVEGKHDKDEILAVLNTPFFSEFREKYEPCVFLANVGGKNRTLRFSTVAGGDITADSGTTASNILGRLNELINDYKKSGRGYPIAHRDIARIVQIVDSDGAFISCECVVRSDDPKPVYLSDTIETANVDGIVGRNRKKAAVLKKLAETDRIGNLPYAVYFVSCNMDHVLFADQNLTSGNKSFHSNEFQSRCEAHPEYIFETILHPEVTVECDYPSSWEEIQEGTNSLCRKTNLNLLLRELSDELL